MNDWPIVLKDEDLPEAPALVVVETVQPRRVRTEIAKHRADLLGFQDEFEGLLAHITSQEGRKIWRQLHIRLSRADKDVQDIAAAVG